MVILCATGQPLPQRNFLAPGFTMRNGSGGIVWQAEQKILYKPVFYLIMKKTEIRWIWIRRMGMIKLYDGGAYLVNGVDIIPDGKEAQAAVKGKTGRDINKEEAAKETIG